MDYIIEYWKEKETNPIEFLSHFRCTTEPIGGSTEFDAEGELVNYDATLVAIDLTKKDLIEKACKWLLKGGYFVNNTETINDFKRAMEE